MFCVFYIFLSQPFFTVATYNRKLPCVCVCVSDLFPVMSPAMGGSSVPSTPQCVVCFEKKTSSDIEKVIDNISRLIHQSITV